MDSKTIRNLLAWFRRWLNHTPARNDSTGWDRVVSELHDIIPADEEAIYRGLYLAYLRMLEAKTA